MDIRDLVKERVAAGDKQVEIAKKTGVSQGTIYKLLYTDSKPTLDIIVKIARAYDKPLSLYVADENIPYVGQNESTLTAKEKRLLSAFRNLDERRQDRYLDTIEDMVLALRESGERGSPAKDLEDSNLKRNSNG